MDSDADRPAVPGNGAAALDRRHTEAWEWRIRGASIDFIMEQMGISSRVTVLKYLRAALDVRSLPDRVQELRIELDRLDRYQQALDDQIAKGRSVTRNVEAAVKLMERRAKYLGLDAPSQIQAAFTQIDPDAIEVIELINEAKAQVALREQQWNGSGPGQGMEHH